MIIDTPLTRRSLLGLGAGLAGAALVSGCSGQATQTPTSPAGSASTDPANLTGVIAVWGALTLDRGVGNLLDAFKKKYPKVEVKYTQFTNNNEGNLKLDTSLQGGAPLDVFFSYGATAISRRTKAGYAMDLTERARGNEVAKRYLDADPPISPFIDGKLYSIPTVYNPYMVYVNEDMMATAGIEIPMDWTVEDFHEISRKLVSGGFAKTATYKNLPIAVPLLGGDAMFTADGKASNFDDPAWKRDYQLIADMEADGTLMPIKQVLAQKVDLYAQSAFLSGQHAFYLDNPASLRFVKDTTNYPHTFKTTFRPMPVVERGKEQWNTGAYEDAIQINAKSKFPEAAWAFTEFWLGEGAIHMLTGGKLAPSMVPSDGKASEEVLSRMLGDQRDQLYNVDELQQVMFDPTLKLQVPTKLTALTEIGTARESLSQKMRLGEITVDQLLTQLKSEADAAIAKALKG